ncbi:hypothetical protein BHM03_00017020 [Ensete ventricosum]|nr:hypothetical protein BHM03_00017020 [Ensete ventricosum]
MTPLLRHTLALRRAQASSRAGDLELCSKVDVHDVAGTAPSDHVDVPVVVAKDSISSHRPAIESPFDLTNISSSKRHHNLS